MKALSKILLSFSSFLFLWLMFTHILKVPAYILPSPFAVLEVFFKSYSFLFEHMKITAFEMVTGFILGSFLAIGLGTLTAYNPLLKRILEPLILFKQGLPSFILAPFLVLWLGIGLESKIFMTALTVFFIVFYATEEGLKTRSEWLMLSQTLKAKTLPLFWHIRFKAALPQIKTGLKTAASMAPAATLAGEWIGSTEGLGFIILHAFGVLETDLMFAALLLCIGLGISFFYGLNVLLNKWIFWHA
jgi:putative hydroxymethylpyrimidine transport system permease protein